MNVKTQTLQMLNEAARMHLSDVFPGISLIAIADSETRLSCRFPEQYKEFLTRCNGISVAPAGIFGIRPPKNAFDLERSYANFPQFKAWRMIPISSDGCGNFYLLDVGSTADGRIYFYDTISNDKPGYVVASDFWHFAYFYITEAQERKGWPFEQDYVLNVDPELASPCKAPLPWRT